MVSNLHWSLEPSTLVTSSRCRSGIFVHYIHVLEHASIPIHEIHLYFSRYPEDRKFFLAHIYNVWLFAAAATSLVVLHPASFMHPQPS